MLSKALELKQGLVGTGGTELASLFEEILGKGTDIRVRVTGNSMKPFLKGGEIVTISKTGCKNLRMGDLILFKNDRGLPVLHRLLRKKKRNNKRYYHAKGDGLVAPDKLIPEGLILGKVYLVEKTIGSKTKKTLDMDNLLWKERNRITALWHLSKALIFSFLLSIKRK